MALKVALEELHLLPPLVFAAEVDRLQNRLAAIQERRGFALFAGDCAENFNELSGTRIREQLQLLLQMSLILSFAGEVPITKIGRVAGQFGKPRSDLTERVGDISLPSFRGHIINGEAFTDEDRAPDPRRMIRGYNHSAAALNLIRGFTSGGLADLHQVHAWNREVSTAGPEGERYAAMVAEVNRAIKFAETVGHTLDATTTEFYTAHEALVLDYEEALTRVDSRTGKFYACSAHFIWVGERTRQLDGAHVEFARGVANPIGVKIGPECTPQELLDLCEALDPQRAPGRLTLFARQGAANVRETLPPLMRAVRDSGRPVTWACDPMHGNTRLVEGTIKTRDFSDIVEETRAYFEIAEETGVWPGGIHLELTPEDVTECTGGSWPVTSDVLAHNYRSLCDPRLNGRQALDIAFETADLLRKA